MHLHTIFEMSGANTQIPLCDEKQSWAANDFPHTELLGLCLHLLPLGCSYEQLINRGTLVSPDNAGAQSRSSSEPSPDGSSHLNFDHSAVVANGQRRPPLHATSWTALQRSNSAPPWSNKVMFTLSMGLVSRVGSILENSLFESSTKCNCRLWFRNRFKTVGKSEDEVDWIFNLEF